MSDSVKKWAVRTRKGKCETVCIFDTRKQARSHKRCVKEMSRDLDKNYKQVKVDIHKVSQVNSVKGKNSVYGYSIISHKVYY